MPRRHFYFIPMFTQLKNIKFILVLILAGILDTLYLSYEHFTNFIPPCPIHSILGSFVDCGKVLSGQYAWIFGIPVAYLGLLYYLFIFFLAIKGHFKFLFALSFFALMASGYFVYLQLFVLHAICLYCMASAIINLMVFFSLLTENYFKDILKMKLNF